MVNIRVNEKFYFYFIGIKLLKGMICKWEILLRENNKNIVVYMCRNILNFEEIKIF